MANIKSAQKRIKVTATKTLRNKMIKSALKTNVKKYEMTLATNNVDEAKIALSKASKALDMAVTKGVIHKNLAARKKSRLAVKLNALNA